MSKFKGVPFYPLLLAVYPVLAMLAFNDAQTQLDVGIRPLLICLGGAIIVFVVLRLLLHSWSRAALLTSLLLAWIFIYGHLYNLLKPVTVLGFAVGRHRILFPIYTLIWLGLAWRLMRSKNSFAGAIPILNVISIGLVVLAVGQIAVYSVQTKLAQLNQAPINRQTSQVNTANTSQLPDIYYIILDMYTRSDTLQTYFHFDNQPFLDKLKGMGFYVATCARSNYTSTETSLGSSLNLDYLQNLGPQFARGSQGWSALPLLMKNNLLRKELEPLGYKSVVFQNEYMWAVWTDADIYLVPTTNAQVLRSLTPFEAMFERSTAAAFLVDAQSVLFQGWASQVNFPYAEHINQVTYLLNKLPTIPSIAGPKLVFVHVLVPHLPFIFKPDGSLQTDENFYRDANEPINDAYFQKGYTDNIQFINQRMLTILQKIIDTSPVKPIIVVQGDHGVKGYNRGSILNAYYLPGGVEKKLYPTITPVNTFRLILDNYFGKQYPLLKDTSYDTPLEYFDFTPLPETAPDCMK
ncbi:MAG: hypothetical protein ABSE06_11585 [Anaerolineaceae bacterium]|jgi:hypothetical protein